MRILHTADWHLGQMLHGVDRNWEHQLFLEWLLQQVEATVPDLLLVAGDVFDSANPPASASRLYYSFLARLALLPERPQVIIVAGNHDSATRLEAPQELLAQLDITVRGHVPKDAQGDTDYAQLVVPLRGGGACLAVPFLRQGDYQRSLGYAEGVAAFYQRAVEQLPELVTPIIALGHLHVSGGKLLSGDASERAIVGGLELVSPSAFSPRVDYVALGHLHRMQRVGGEERIRYSGAPLPMSFTEEHYRQGVLQVELSKEGLEVSTLEYTSPLRLQTIGPATKAQVLQQIALLPPCNVGEPLAKEAPLLRVLVQLEEPEPSLRHQLEQALQGKLARLVVAQPIYPQQEGSTEVRSMELLEQRNELEVAQMAYQETFATDMPKEMVALLRELIIEMEEEEDNI